MLPRCGPLWPRRRPPATREAADMPLFIAGFALIFSGLLGWSLGTEFNWLRYESASIPYLLAAIVIAPSLAAWITAETLPLASPRRVFDRRRRTHLARFTLGFATGLGSALVAAAALPWADRVLPDSAVFGLSSVLVVGIALSLCSWVRPGHCIHCGYDLRNSPGPGQPGAGR